jgi:HK97 family phage prohead protease
MYNEIQFKANSGQVNIDQAEGIVECFVAGIGNKDSVGDIVLSGAFSKSLMRRKPRVVWGHNWNDPIGKVLEIYEVPPSDPRLPAKMKMAGIGGLFAKVQFNLNSEKGREAFANVAFFGVEQEWSIGYKTLDAIFDNTRQANLLREVELYEVSPVLHGANQLTGTISVKSDEEKMHMMGGMGMPNTIVIARPEDEGPQEPRDPFAMGIAQPLSDDRRAGLQQELVSRTGGPIHVLKATESSVVFMKPGRGLYSDSVTTLTASSSCSASQSQWVRSQLL